MLLSFYKITLLTEDSYLSSGLPSYSCINMIQSHIYVMNNGFLDIALE